METLHNLIIFTFAKIKKINMKNFLQSFRLMTRHIAMNLKAINIGFKIWTVSAVLLLFSLQSQAQLLNENFSYANGALLTANGWAAHSGAGTNPITVYSDSLLTYPGYLSSGIGNRIRLISNGEDVNKTFTAQTSGTVYASALVNITATSTTGDYFIHFGATVISTIYQARVFVKKDASNNLAFGISKSSGTANYTPFNYALNTTYLLVFKYSFNTGSTTNDTVSLIINPTLNATEPISGWTKGTDAATDLANVGCIALRQGTAANLVTLRLDGVRVANNWADIVGSAVVNPPTWTAGWPKSEDAISNGFNAKANISAPGTAYYVVLPNGATAPTAAQVKAGKDATGTPVAANLKGSIACTLAATEYTASVTGLNGSTTYNVYFIAEDGNANLQSTPVMTSVTTTAAALAPIMGAPTATGINSTSATLGGSITSDGGSAILTRGTVWNTTGTVSINDNPGVEGGTTTGAFSHLRSSLPAQTQIFYKAFASNIVGTTLSAESSFYTLAVKPTYHVSSFAAAAAGTTQINLSWGAAAGCDGYLILKKSGATAPTGVPVDATAYTVGNTIGDGIVAANIAPGSAISAQITGLSSMTQYSFTIIPYAFDGLNYQTLSYNTTATIPSATATTDAPPATIYTWNANNGDYSLATNWTPNRTTHLTNDILVFNNGANDTLTGVISETIGQLLISNNSNVNFQASADANLNIGGYTGTDFTIESGSKLNLVGTSAITLKLLTTATASINGSMGCYGAAHKLDAADAGAIVFGNGAYFTQGTGCTGNAFTNTGTANAVVFASGSTLAQYTGSNPFGLTAPASKIVFETGSLFLLKTAITPSFSGRTYANFELDAAGSIVVTGSTVVSINNLTVTNGNFYFNMTGTAGHAIKGNIHVAAGQNLYFAPATVGTVNLNGTSLQTISGTGNIKTTRLSTLNLNNSNGFQVNDSMSISGIINFTSGNLNLGANIAFSDSASVAGTPSVSSMIIPNTFKVYKKFLSGYSTSFTYPIGAFEAPSTYKYVPVSLNFASGTFDANNYVGVNTVSAKNPNDVSIHNYLNRYWDVTSSGVSGFSCNANFNYSTSDVQGTESLIFCENFSLSPIGVYAATNATLHQLTADTLTQFGTFGGGEEPVLTRTLNVKCFLEGLYDITSGLMIECIDGNTGFPQWGAGITDKINIELRQATAPYGVVETFNNVNLHTNGMASVQVNPQNSGSYYIKITNHNHLETWSATAVPLTNAISNYDFSTGLLQAYGSSPQALVSGAPETFAFYLGDLNQSGYVDLDDFVIFEPDLTNGNTGYLISDFNGSGYIDLDDFALFEPRLTLGNASEYPAKK